jgi:hypothetical protein
LARVSSAFDEVDHDTFRFALAIGDLDVISIAGSHLVKQRQRIVVVHKAHGLTRVEGVQRTENSGVTKPFGNTARVEWIDRFFGRVIAGVNGDHGENLLMDKLDKLDKREMIIDRPRRIFDLRQVAVDA